MKSDTHLDWLDYARCFAAGSVLFFHYAANGPRTGQTGSIVGFGLLTRLADYGYLGVDIFFIISGFVILSSSLGRQADTFAVSRAARLWPTFALCCTSTAFVVALSGGEVSLVQYFGNLTMVPKQIGVRPIDGVYWTLAFELVFYAAVFFLMLFGLLANVRVVVPIWIALICAARIFGFSPPLLGQFFELFAAGCVLALAKRAGWNMTLVGLFLVCSWLVYDGVAARAAPPIAGGFDPHIAGGLMLLVLFAFAGLLTFDRRLPFARLMGEMTYPLYLLHPKIGYAVMRLFDANGWLALALAIALVVGLSAVVVVAFERPTARLRKVFFDRSLGPPVRRIMKLLTYGRRPVEAH